VGHLILDLLPRAVDIESYLAICALKARYCRFIDQKDYASLPDLFTDDVTWEREGRRFEGRDAVVAFISGAMDTMTTVHMVANPELGAFTETTASFTWAMQDHLEVIDSDPPEIVLGYGHYSDEFRLESQGWRISRVVLTRTRVDRSAGNR
jgi:hypothetical protein